MSAIRCKAIQNFHDDGSVKEPCPEGSECTWIHPSQPEWVGAASNGLVTQLSDVKNEKRMSYFKRLYKRMIYEAQETVCLQIELDTAKYDLSRFKRCQNSSIYAHAQPKVRDILDAERTKREQAVRDLDKKFQKAVALSKFSHSEISTKYDAILMSEDSEDTAGIKSYISELRTWSDSLREMLASSSRESPLGADDPAKWSYKQVNKSLEEMNTLLDRSIGAAFEDRYIDYQGDVRSETKEDVHRDIRGGTKGDVEAMVRRLRRLQVRGKDAEDWERLENHLEEAERLVGPSRYVYEAKEKLTMLIEKQDADLAQLKARLEHVEELGVQMKERLKKYAQMAEEDAAKIQALKERVAYLHSLPNPAIQPSEDILHGAKVLVERLLHDDSDLNPSKMLWEMVASTTQKHIGNFEDKLRQIDEATEALFQQASEMGRI